MATKVKVKATSKLNSENVLEELKDHGVAFLETRNLI